MCMPFFIPRQMEFIRFVIFDLTIRAQCCRQFGRDQRLHGALLTMKHQLDAPVNCTA